MKKHLFRIIAVLSAAVLLAGCAASRLRLGAAAAGGVYNAFGTAMSAQNSTIEVKQTAGSAANLRLLAGGYLQLAVAQSDMAQDAYDGSGVFAGGLRIAIRFGGRDAHVAGHGGLGR